MHNKISHDLAHFEPKIMPLHALIAFFSMLNGIGCLPVNFTKRAIFQIVDIYCSVASTLLYILWVRMFQDNYYT